jgi:hypothetical protein
MGLDNCGEFMDISMTMSGNTNVAMSQNAGTRDFGFRDAHPPNNVGESGVLIHTHQGSPSHHGFQY